MSKNKKKVIILLVIAALIALVPLFTLRGAEFGGSDDAGSKVVSQITGNQYKPWATPVMEKWIGGELPGEIESLLFCVQTGIGVGVVAFFMGRLVERKKQESQKSKTV
ncbi:cobalt transport protein CbiN [Clostridiaceae bacterium UIB06]|uniref:Cobalt transport protein CbiN n=1 Tax=Clostridium thailandense TaxID=2794346 RepID=A0A949TMN3_9CLOT|nr:cobalt transport protein CbiN [Clostridium thailandense]MBV7275190.1 cobalt transport protein CbiN [Clostridium thailandense]MCH5136826.1 cobalt transport protein CbiN [Clostridiaceae bacterium UIB06]